jgi:hypothetical protein
MAYKVNTKTNLSFFKKKDASVSRRFSDFLGKSFFSLYTIIVSWFHRLVDIQLLPVCWGAGKFLCVFSFGASLPNFSAPALIIFRKYGTNFEKIYILYYGSRKMVRLRYNGFYISITELTVYLDVKIGRGTGTGI